MKNGWIRKYNSDYRSCWDYHYVNDLLHSIDDQPSALLSTGLRMWHYLGKLHRETGPASIYSTGDKSYYFYGSWYSEIQSDLEWILKVEELKKNLTKSRKFVMLRNEEKV